MTFKELDEKLREGVQAEVDEQYRKNAHRAIEKALIKVLPSDFEVPDSMLEQVNTQIS